MFNCIPKAKENSLKCLKINFVHTFNVYTFVPHQANVKLVPYGNLENRCWALHFGPTIGNILLVAVNFELCVI